MTPHIEKVSPDGTKRFGSLSDNAPGVVLLIRPTEASMLMTNMSTVERAFDS